MSVNQNLEEGVTEPKERKGPEEVWGVPSVQFTGPLGPLAQG